MAKLLTPIYTESNGERAVAKILREQLGEEFFIWHNVPIKSHKKRNERYPDFIVFNRRYGFWVLEVKDWGLSFIRGHNSKEFTLVGQTVKNPYAQSSEQAFALQDLLRKEKRLNNNGYLILPVVFGVIFFNINRRQFEYPEEYQRGFTRGKLGAIPSERVICSDELKSDNSNIGLENRLLAMIGKSEAKHDLSDLPPVN